jgi:hypothetical protein
MQKTIKITGKFARKHQQGNAAYNPQILLSGKYLPFEIGELVQVTITEDQITIKRATPTAPASELDQLKEKYKALGIETNAREWKVKVIN